MATISKLTCSSFAGSAGLSSPASRSSEPKLSVGFRSRSPIDRRSSPLNLSVRRNRAGGFPLIVKCSQDGNGATIKRTTLHDLYENQGQSPWYDNLCRPVTDLLPLIASGVRGVTSNPTIFQKAISSSSAYDEQFRNRFEPFEMQMQVIQIQK